MKNVRRTPFTASGSAGANRDAAPREPLDWPAAAGAVDDVLTEMRARLKRRRRHRVRSFAGTIAALLMAGFVWRSAIRAPEPRETATSSATVAALPARQILADGSVVELRSDARVAVAFTVSLRRVVLEKGEAHFQVLTDRERPFIVSAGGVEFRAVGTAFAVELGEKKVALLVTEGSVAVDRPVVSAETARAAGAMRANPTLAVVEKGHRVVLELGTTDLPAPSIDAVSESELDRRLAWRAPKLEFSGTPLSEALELINGATSMAARSRQTTRLVLGDPELGEVRISGVLRADNVATLLGVLETTYGIKAEQRGESEIVLRKVSTSRKPD